MKIIFILSILLVLTSCSTQRQRTKFSDKGMRVMINPEGLAREDYMNISTNLVMADVWTVVDRSSGIRAIKREQEETHKQNYDRYDNKEKFAHWGKLYGVGSVVVAQSECRNRPNPWRVNETRNFCRLYLNLIDTNTAEIIVGVNVEADAPFMTRPDWNEAVEKLAEAYPKFFKREKLEKELLEYKEESEKLAVEHELAKK